MELELERTVGHASTALEHGDRLVEALLKGHGQPSLYPCMRRGEDGAGIAEAVRAHIYCKCPGKESRKWGSALRMGILQPQKTHTQQRSAPCLSRNNTPNNGPKPASATASKRGSVSNVTAVRRNTPPSPSSRPSMTWGCLKTSCPRSKGACTANRSSWEKSSE